MFYSNILPPLLVLIWLVLYVGIFVYLPGYFLVAKLKFTGLDAISLSFIFGFAYYSLVAYLVRFTDLPFYLSEIILIAPTITEYAKLKKHLDIIYFRQYLSGFKRHLWLFFILIISAPLHAGALLSSGRTTPLGTYFSITSFHDSMQHLSIIERLYRTSQLTQPGFARSHLTNYHYLIDLTLAAITRFHFLPLFDIYYRYYPLFISVTFSLMLFVLVRKITHNNLLALSSIIFTIFAGNASYFVHFFRGPEFTYDSSTFMINPLSNILQNPASTFVLSELLAVIFLVLSRFQRKTAKQHYFPLIFITSVIAGTMIGFKAWGGLLIIGGLGLTSLWSWITNSKTTLLLIWLITLVISLILFLPHYHSATSASPVWAPGWSLKVMVNDAGRWNYLPDIFKADYYTVRHHPFHLLLLYLKWAVIYVLGNYWLRLIGLFTILFWIRHLPKLKSPQILIISITTASLLLPLFFNQGSMAYDIEQFSPYALLLASIFTLVFFRQHLLAKVSHSKQLIILCLLIILSFPSNYPTLKARIHPDQLLIPKELMDTYSQITSLVPPDATIMLYPSDRNLATLEFAALTDRNTYYSGRTLSIIVGNDYNTRRQQLKDFFDTYSNSDRHNYVLNHHINYLFLYPQEREKRSNIPDFASPLIENPSGSLYQFNIQ